MTTIQPPKPTSSFIAYHHGKVVKRVRGISPEQRQFIAWDGEGINIGGTGKPQSYVLFGSSDGCITSKIGLNTFQCLDHIIATGERNPKAFHVGFAFTYDANMICQGLSPTTLYRLHKKGMVHLRNAKGERYTVTFARGKFFRITKYRTEYDAKHNPTAKVTVQIYDIFSFFACSFIKAYEGLVGPVPGEITKGKAARPEFSLADMDDIETYWSIEIQLLKRLAEELRRRVYNAGLRITQWHGPGALASYAMNEHKIKQHMKASPDEVRLAARYGYAGGRFELFKVGRVLGPVYGVDINSAYPHAISQLPSLTEGYWRYVENPNRIVKFGIYHVRIKRFTGFVRQPGPLFHRDRSHNISFPWVTEGWYFSPEAHIAKRCGATILEGWEYVGWTTRPFEWVVGMYHTRRDWKLRGISAQLALKLCLNSVYGKLAQRVGWNEETGRIPAFHQLEWAGWVTSYVRARLFNVMMGIPFNQLIAIETDGIYTTTDPAKLGITDDNELGGWSVSQYEEVLYVQSGLAWLRDTEGNWTDKRRGLDPCRQEHTPNECHCPGTFSLNACRDYLRSLHPKPNRKIPWHPYIGETTRFVGMGSALASFNRTASRHCVWETNPRELAPGFGGKRVHIHGTCDACQVGATAYDAPHDLAIHSLALLSERSYPHSIPWEAEIGHADWRNYEESQNGDVTPQYV